MLVQIKDLAVNSEERVPAALHSDYSSTAPSIDPFIPHTVNELLTKGPLEIAAAAFDAMDPRRSHLYNRERREEYASAAGIAFQIWSGDPNGLDKLGTPEELLQRSGDSAKSRTTTSLPFQEVGTVVFHETLRHLASPKSAESLMELTPAQWYVEFLLPLSKDYQNGSTPSAEPELKQRAAFTKAVAFTLPYYIGQGYLARFLFHLHKEIEQRRRKRGPDTQDNIGKTKYLLLFRNSLYRSLQLSLKRQHQLKSSLAQFSTPELLTAYDLHFNEFDQATNNYPDFKKPLGSLNRLGFAAMLRVLQENHDLKYACISPKEFQSFPKSTHSAIDPFLFKRLAQLPHETFYELALETLRERTSVQSFFTVAAAATTKNIKEAEGFLEVDPAMICAELTREQEDSHYRRLLRVLLGCVAEGS